MWRRHHLRQRARLIRLILMMRDDWGESGYSTYYPDCTDVPIVPTVPAVQTVVADILPWLYRRTDCTDRAGCIDCGGRTCGPHCTDVPIVPTVPAAGRTDCGGWHATLTVPTYRLYRPCRPYSLWWTYMVPWLHRRTDCTDRAGRTDCTDVPIVPIVPTHLPYRYRLCLLYWMSDMHSG